jgi:uncharacterized protein YbcI
MADEDTPKTTRATEHGEMLLRRISTEMAHIQKLAFGKGPTHTKSYMFDDMLLVVMRDGLTVAEHTMVGFGQEDLVRNFRQQFENEMKSRLIHLIEGLTERNVLTYQSQIMFHPDIVIEMFVFDPRGDFDESFTTAEGQTDDDEADRIAPT